MICNGKERNVGNWVSIILQEKGPKLLKNGQLSKAQRWVDIFVRTNARIVRFCPTGEKFLVEVSCPRTVYALLIQPADIEDPTAPKPWINC